MSKILNRLWLVKATDYEAAIAGAEQLMAARRDDELAVMRYERHCAVQQTEIDRLVRENDRLRSRLLNDDLRRMRDRALRLVS